MTARGAGPEGSATIKVISIPTPFAVGRVNCYLVEDDPLTLVDCGPNSGTSLMELESGLAEHGRRVEDLERIVLTHQHIDHTGLAQILAERSGAEICALDRLAPWLEHYRERMDADDRFAERIMLRHGVPRDVAYALRAVSATFRAWGASAHVDRPMADGEELPFAGRAWRVLHRPGHSPSDTVILDTASGELLGGDHLIGHISSNPLLSRPLEAADDDSESERPRSLLVYLDSMRATRELDVTSVLPGHGEPVEDHRALIDDRIAGHERRAGKIAALLAGEPKSAFEIANDLWGNVAVVQAYLTLSEVLGHLDLLLERGEIVELGDDGDVTRFTAAG